MDELEPVDPFERMLQEEKKAQDALSARYKSLQDSLQRRINMPFDPTLMRVATALLSPTKSGTTGESIGAAAGALIDESEKEALRQREVAKMQIELEEKMLQMQRSGMGLQMLRKLPAGTRPSEATTAAGATSGVSGYKVAEPDPIYSMSDRDYLAQMFAGSKEPLTVATAMQALMERNKNRYQFNQSGTFDRATGMVTPNVSGEGKPGVAYLTDPRTGKGGKYEMSAADAARFDELQRRDPVAYQQRVNQYFGIEPSPAKPSGAAALVQPSAIEGQEAQPVETKPVEPAVAEAPTRVAGVTPRRQTVQESEISKAASEQEAKGIAEVSTKIYENLSKNYENAPILLEAAQTMNQLVEQNPDAFRTLSKPGLAQTIMRAADQGIQVGVVGGIKLPAAELAKYKLSQKELDVLNLFANQLAIAKNANRQMTKVAGEGAISDFETQLANQMLAVDNASPEAIGLINKFTIKRADHILQRFQLLERLRSEGMSISQAMISQEMRDLRQRYGNDLRDISQQGASILSASKKTMKGKIKSLEGGESDVPPGYIRDPQTKVIRRKREGE